MKHKIKKNKSLKNFYKIAEIKNQNNGKIKSKDKDCNYYFN